MAKKRIAITIGDMCGIGPEITLKAIADPKVQAAADLIVIGPAYFEKKIGAQAEYVIAGSLQEDEVTPGKVNAKTGQASIAFVEKAINLCQSGLIAGLVTAPINKESICAAQVPFPGHTELLAHHAKTTNFGMAFYSEKLKLVLTTIHVALSEVPRLIKKEKVLQKIKLADQFIKDLGKHTPEIVVAGLNPHAGESGRFGLEEQVEIKPAIEAAQKAGLHVHGPYPADTIFRDVINGKYDIIVAHYHDQGLIPLKLLSFNSAVNVTVGLPFIRTSVGHGTAFDIVGQNKADPASLIEAIKIAVRLAQNKSI